LGPDKVGLASTYMSFLAAGSVLVHLGWETALVRDYRAQRSEEERAALIQHVVMIRSALFAALLVVSASTFLFLGSINPALFAMCAAIVATDTMNLFWLLQAREDHDLNLRLRMAQQLSAAVLIFAFFRPGQTLGSDLAVRAASGLAVLVWTLWRFVGLNFVTRPLLSTVHFAIGYARTNFALTILSLCAYLGTQFNEGVLGVANSAHALGVYRAATTMALAVEEVATLVMLVVYPRMLEWHSKGGNLLWRRQLQLSFATFIAGTLCCGLAWAFGPAVFSLVFGHEYLNASGPFTILAATKFAILIKTYFYFALLAQRRDKTLLAVTMPLTVVGCVVNYALVRTYGAYGTSFVNLGLQVLLALFFIWFSRQQRELNTHG